MKIHNQLTVKYLNIIERAIEQHLPSFGNQNVLLEACRYAVSSGGKRLRPTIVLLVADALGNRLDATFASLCVEFFHTASLVADDMPAMDDDDERRNLPSVHKKFGEGAALLVSYALIAMGYECISRNSMVLRNSGGPFASSADQIGMLALENAAYNTGLEGATGGQFLDMNPPDLSIKSLKEIVHKKTTSLFEIAFVLGWLFGGGSESKLADVKAAASHFGLAFQILDDLGDMQQDLRNNRSVNIANVVGKEAALRLFHVEQRDFLLKISDLGLDPSTFASLIPFNPSLPLSK